MDSGGFRQQLKKAFNHFYLLFHKVGVLRVNAWVPETSPENQLHKFNKLYHRQLTKKNGSTHLPIHF
jgi:hypothetical protein